MDAAYQFHISLVDDISWIALNKIFHATCKRCKSDSTNNVESSKLTSAESRSEQKQPVDRPAFKDLDYEMLFAIWNYLELELVKLSTRKAISDVICHIWPFDQL